LSTSGRLHAPPFPATTGVPLFKENAHRSARRGRDAVFDYGSAVHPVVFEGFVGPQFQGVA
jgi:hypothetical protein